MMRLQDIIVAAASAAFFFAGVASVNDSEAINVALPAQYQVIWDQSPYAAPAGMAQADLGTESRSPRLEVVMPVHGYGHFARNYRTHTADRG